MIVFDRPDMLILILIVPIVIIIHFVSLLFFSRSAFKFANFETIRRMHNQKNVFSKRIPQLFIRVVFLVILVFAAAGTSVWIKTEGYMDEVIFALDTSGSMLATDLEPSRIEVAKSALAGFFSNSSGYGQAGIISFTSLVYLETYPTDDRRELISTVENIKIRKSRGTSIGVAINFATIQLSRDSEKEKSIIILTDAQENVLTKDELEEIVTSAKEKKIRINIIGIGSSSGASINEETLGKSILNEENIKLIAGESGGEYTIALTREDIVSALENYISVSEIERKIRLDIWLFLLGFIMLLLEWHFSNYLFRTFP